MTTQYANASYQEVIDLHTESDSVSVIGIHTPISDTPHKMMKGFFEQFKKFKYAGCSVSLVPAARLPADPLQVSYEAGETTIDPRDMLNPLMFHGCHGNDLGMVLNRLYNLNSGNSLSSDSVNLHQGNVIQSDFVESDLILDGQELENLYYKALTDNTWKKAHPQRGFRKSGLHPMIYSLATTQQIMNESLIAAPTSPYNIGLTRGVPAPAEFDYDTVSNPAEWSVDVPINRQFKLMTPRIQKLGWLDTKQVLTTAGSVDGTFDTTGMSESEVREALSEAFTGALNGIVESQEVYATLPKIYMGVILMPPAYKTEQYFRMIITHHFEFKNFRGISFANDIHESPCYDNWNEDISLGSGGDTGGEVDPPNPGEGGGDDPPAPTPKNTFSDFFGTGANISALGDFEYYDTFEDVNGDTWDIQSALASKVLALNSFGAISTVTYAHFVVGEGSTSGPVGLYINPGPSSSSYTAVLFYKGTVYGSTSGGWQVINNYDLSTLKGNIASEWADAVDLPFWSALGTNTSYEGLYELDKVSS